jgi:hypothetical protein
MNENVPKNQSFIFGLNFGQDKKEYATAEVKGIEKNFNASRLYAYELGNEPDLYTASERLAPWNVTTYAEQQYDWLMDIKKEVRNDSHGFQLGAFAASTKGVSDFTIASINKLGLPQTVSNVK